MNRSYNIVWNTARNMYMVTGEFIRSGNARCNIRTLKITIGVIMAVGNFAHAEEIGPQNGASISIKNGDTITASNGGTGIDSSTIGGTGVKINGKSDITVFGGTGSLIGINLDNGTDNNLGTGTYIDVGHSLSSSEPNSTATGILINDQQINTAITANELYISVYSGTGSAYGIQDVGIGGITDIGQASHIQTSSTDKYDAYGIYLAKNSGEFKLSNSTIIATAEQGHSMGIYSTGNASVDLGSDTTIWVTSDKGSTGISVGDSGILKADSLILAGKNSEGGTEVGLSLGDRTHADLGNESTIYLDGNGSLVEGVTLDSGASLIANNIDITVLTTNTDNSGGRGILLNGAGASADLGNGSEIIISGFNGGSAIEMMDGSGTFTANNLTVNATGDGWLYGIKEEGGQMNLGVGSSISATGQAETIWVTGGQLSARDLTVNTQQSTGINAQGGPSDVVVNIGDDTVVDGRDIGGGDGTTNGIVASYAGFGSGTTIFNFNGNSVNRNKIYAVNGYGAAALYSGQTLNISNTDITMSGDGKSYGLKAVGDDDVTSGGIINGDNLTIDMTDTGADSAGVVTQHGGQINLAGNTTITTDGGVAFRNDKTIGSQSGELLPGGTINGSGKMLIKGDIVNDGWGAIDLTMDTGSDFIGATSVNTNVQYMNSSAYSTLDLTLANQTTWTITNNSSLTNLTNAGRVIFSSDTESGTYSTLHADTLTLQDTSELDIDYAAAAQASSNNAPLITSGTVTLDGDLKISDSGVADLSNLTTDQQLTQEKIILIDANSAINGNFSHISADSGTQPDYLTLSGQIDSNDNTLYLLGMGLSWYSGDASATTNNSAHGTFTVGAGKSFEVTSTLADVSPDTTTGWDGKSLTKKGDGTLILSGDSTYSGGTNIADGEVVASNINALGSGDIDNSGTLTLDAGGAFDLTQNIITRSEATTHIAQSSALTVNTLTQEDNSSLDVYLDLSSTQPIITAQQANLDGMLNIIGITSAPNSDYTKNITVIDAAQDITGDFESLTIAGSPASQVDFISIEGRVDAADSTNYVITAGLTWYADSYNSLTSANGTFTVSNVGQSFTLGTALEDVLPNSNSGWDGKTLTKKGDGTLILDAVNTYDGSTNVQDGMLWLNQDAAIGIAGSQQLVYVAQDAAFGGDTATVNGNVENSGSLYFDNTMTINGNMTNNGAIVSGNSDIMLPVSTLTDSKQPSNTLVINGDYTGNGGSLTLNTYLGNDSSPTDKLVVNGNTSGDTRLYINQAGGEGLQTTEGIEVVQVNGTSDGVFTQGNQVQAGLYEYRLYQDDNNGDWYLRSQTSAPPDPDDGGDDNDTPVTPQYRPDIGVYLGNQWMARNLQMQTLYDREGSQYRNTDGSLWARFKNGEADSHSVDGLVDNDHSYSQFQLGGDILAWNNGEQGFLVGLMGSYINADTDSTGNRGADSSQFSASGNVDGYNLGTYATWFADAQKHSGIYIDGWYQYGIYDNSVDDGDVGSEKYDSSAHALSLESGYRYDISLASENSVSITPQAQVIWQRFEADNVTDNNGTSIENQNGDSWDTRLGFRVEGNLYKHSFSVVQPFAEVNWLHTSNDESVTFDDVSVKQDIPSNRAELKMGIQANINQQWRLRAQVAGQKGSNDYSDINGSLNLRYNW